MIMTNRSFQTLLLGLLSFLIFSAQGLAQKPNTNMYEKEWRIIDSLDESGLPQSALKSLNELAEKVDPEKEPDQYLKILFYRAKFITQTNEEGLVEAITGIEQYIPTAEFPIKPILQSVLGQFYQSYLDGVIWQIRDRTTLERKTDDFRTWSVQDFVEKSTALYEASLEEAEKLKAIPISDFPAIIQGGRLSDGLRRTLFDVLAHRAIDNFTNEKNYLTRPAYEFVVDEKNAFANPESFAAIEWTTQDTGSHKLKALQLLQQLIDFHLKDEDPEALVDVDLKRLKLVYNYARLNNKDQLYMDALRNLKEMYEGLPVEAEILYEIADYYYAEGSSENAELDSVKNWRYKDAYELCAKCMDKYPKTYGAMQCANLQGRIQQTNLSLEIEQVNLPNQPILISVNYRNVDQLHMRVVKLEERDEQALNRRYDEDRIDYLFNLKPVQKQRYELPDPGDYRGHKTEVKLDGLDYGRYVILASESGDFPRKESLTSVTYFNVSRIGYFQRSGEDGKNQFVLMDRATGAPLAEVKAEYFISEYNSKKKSYYYIKAGEQYSNAQGLINSMATARKYWTVKFSLGKDQLYMSDSYRNYSRPTGGYNKRKTTRLFLDRAIYRPGQTVFFKGIVLEEGTVALPTIVAGQKVTLTLLDVNDQKVAEQELTTNEYGTLNGRFETPANVLPGQMQIKADIGNSAAFFSVEEYKRPKFEVKLDELEKSYALGDEVKVTGAAQGFAGNPVDGAVANYRVYRTVRYPWLPWWIRMPGLGAEVEITRGEAETDENGQFAFTFEALPDPGADSTRNPVFQYNIEVDVVDITGETHSDQQRFTIGFVGLQADLQIPDRLDKQKKTTVTLSTTNLNNGFVPAEGQLVFRRLDAPEQYFIDRHWEEPDLYTMSEKNYKKDFPFIAYKGEDKMYEWPQLEEMASLSFNTAESKEVALDLSQWPLGYYVVELQTQDDSGNELRKMQYFYVYDSETKSIPSFPMVFYDMGKKRLEPGEEMVFQMASNNEEHQILLEIEHEGSIIRQEWRKINDWTAIKEAVKEEYRGGFFLYVSSILHNRIVTHYERVEVPWSNKQLDISYGTFRDKLRPGQQEEWRLTISGPEKEKAAAEMLVSMYDASLDQFTPHSWSFDPYPTYQYGKLRWSARHFRSTGSQQIAQRPYPRYQINTYRVYPSLNLYGLQYVFYSRGRYYPSSYAATARSADTVGGPPPPPPPPEPAVREESVMALSEVQEVQLNAKSSGIEIEQDEQPVEQKTNQQIVPRTNLKETVFFMPELRTDEDGNVIVSFTMNEALTRWKFMGLAHTKDLKIGYTEREVVTQKELMVLPNPPRFLRQGDELEITAKVSNLSDKDLSGQAELQFFDATNMQPVNEQLLVNSQTIDFEVAQGRSAPLAWKLKVPQEMTAALVYRIIARAGEFSDGEESALPVLSNRIFLTETMPLTVRGRSTETFRLDRMEKVLASQTATPHQLTMEVTSNPAWLAIKALPYLMEYPHECTEQIFHRYYANSLAMGIANAHPQIEEIFRKWKNTAALESELMKNEELKSAILEETPWVLNAMAEEQQRRNMAVLFDRERMNREQFATLNKLREYQMETGGFPWFPGGPESRYITQLVVEGLGHLESLGISGENEVRSGEDILEQAIAFVDAALEEEYIKLEERVEKGLTTFETDHLSYLAIHYLYARSFFQDIPIPENTQPAYAYYTGQAEEYWLKRGFYQQGMIGLALHRMDRSEVPERILASLKERSLQSDEMGVYWNLNASYWWYELPIETHSMLVELFAQVGDDPELLDEMKIWLLRNKQTNSWETTKATAAAVYALLNQGRGLNQIDESWLVENELVNISFPELKKREYEDKLEAAEAAAEPGTGYYKVQWDREEISKGLSEIKVKNKNKSISWGGVYWQYFEDLDKVEAFEDTPLQLKKRIYKETVTDMGEKLIELDEGNPLKPGDQLVVRIELRVDRDMEYVHMKDMRGSGLEPLEVFSRYKWQDGLGYYQSTLDVATNFFFDYLPKGTYVFEYPLRVIHKGDYSSGITSIQCMYAPEFSSHSQSVRLKVE